MESYGRPRQEWKTPMNAATPGYLRSRGILTGILIALLLALLPVAVWLDL